MTSINSSLLAFLNASPTPFHATQELARLLESAGFNELDETQAWHLQPGQGYYATRAGSSLIAFIYGEDGLQNGIRVLGAHTDSPCLKLKPQPEWHQQGYQQFGVEVYGGVLLYPWFDRDLSLAGAVSWLDENRKLQQSLVNFEKPMAVIPSLAIHLNREANRGGNLNPEQHMRPLWLQSSERMDFREYLQAYLQERLDDKSGSVTKVMDFNLSFYDTQPAALIGENQEFIASARLDNLLSCYVGAAVLAKADRRYSSMLICNDHEEVGSRSDIGAQGSLLSDVLERLEPGSAERQQILRASMLLSVDNAHGIHPNYQDKHEKNHGPLLNAGPVLKFNANQSYATASDTAALVRLLAESGDAIPLQAFAVRADMACGSTIGPLTAARTGIRTLDLGVPTFAMHSIRELGGAQDSDYLCDLLSRFLARADCQ